jgi:hypothetical protein
MKKRLFVTVLVLVFALSAVACKKKTGGHPIEGKWKIVSATGTLASINVGTLYIFKDDKTVLMKKGILETPGTYTIEGNTVTIKIGSMKIKADFEISGNKMTYKMLTSDQVFIMERQ